MALQFRKATKSQSRLRMALIGISGSGKTYTALNIAKSLEGPIAVIDTERGSASKYSDLFDFDVLELESFSPMQFVEAIQAAEAAGYKTLIIDSLSHAWMGKEGALEQVDKFSKRSQSGNSFGAWRDVTPMHNGMIDAILGSRMHIIATMRAKTEYAQEKDSRTGKTTVRKVGVQPVQRDGLEYEFDVVADLDQENNLIIGKTRCSTLSEGLFPKAGDDVAAILNAWLTDGAPEPETKVDAAEVGRIDDDGYVWCGCGVQAKHIVAKSGAGWICGKTPKGCDFKMKDTGQEGLQRTKLAATEASTPEPAKHAVADQADCDAWMETFHEANALGYQSDGYQPFPGGERGTMMQRVSDMQEYIRTRTAEIEASEEARNAADRDTEDDAPANPHTLTDAQHRAILAIAGRVFGHAATAEDFATVIDKPVNTITRSEASALIDRLRFMLAEQQNPGAPAKSTPKEEPHPLDDIADKSTGPEISSKIKETLAARSTPDPEGEALFAGEPEAAVTPESTPQASTKKVPPHVLAFHVKSQQLQMTDDREKRMQAVNNWRTTNGFEPVESTSDIAKGQMVPMMQALNEGALKW